MPMRQFKKTKRVIKREEQITMHESAKAAAYIQEWFGGDKVCKILNSCHKSLADSQTASEE